MTAHKDISVIEIDFDVYQSIVARQRGFDDSPNAVLRRVFDLPTESTELAPGNVGAMMELEIAPDNVELPHGTELRMEYWGIRHTGKIQNGEWIIKGKHVKSPSAAAIEVAGGVSLNGWKYWWVKRPSDKTFIPLESLRYQ
ncbi:MAG: hypothetical protein OXC91_11925 [Rhodobacteraceae bacterium]|nr:hypothetical protein [Paracoccaceae bacterium]